MYAAAGHDAGQRSRIYAGLAAAVVLALCLGLSVRAAAGPVVVWSYYDSPPFVTGESTGLAYDFVEMLNAAAGGRYVFTLKVVPRKRVDCALEQGGSGLVLFVNPAWMNRPERYRWSSPLMHDRNGVLSGAALRLDYSGVEAVRGLILGGVYGRRYQQLDEAVERGVLRREDAPSVYQNVQKLAGGRVDFIIAPESVLRCLVRELGLSDRVYFSPRPHAAYTRHIMLAAPEAGLEEFIEQFIAGLPRNPRWKELHGLYLDRCGMRPAVP
jgi:polar amino acid transport system substrate-binding protein